MLIFYKKYTNYGTIKKKIDEAELQIEWSKQR